MPLLSVQEQQGWAVRIQESFHIFTCQAQSGWRWGVGGKREDAVAVKHSTGLILAFAAYQPPTVPRCVTSSCGTSGTVDSSVKCYADSWILHHIDQRRRRQSYIMFYTCCACYHNRSWSVEAVAVPACCNDLILFTLSNILCQNVCNASARGSQDKLKIMIIQFSPCAIWSCFDHNQEIY